MLALLFFAAPFARAASPVLFAIEPPCGQRGTTQQVILRGAYIEDIEAVLAHEPGVKITLLGEAPLPVASDKRIREVKARIEIPADQSPGNVHLRIRTRTGISSPRQFHVNRLPIIDEVPEQTASRETAQLVPMEHTVWGHLLRYETDWFRIPLRKGQRCSLEMLGLRISPTIIDGVLRVFTPDGKLFKEADTSALYYHDPVCSFIAPVEGEYRVSLHDPRHGVEQNDARYGLGSDCLYVIHVGDYPQPDAVWPLGGKLGETRDFTFTGAVGGAFQQRVTLPRRETFRRGPVNALEGGWPFQIPDAVYPVQDGIVGTGPVFVMASPQTSVMEQREKHDSRESAQALPQPPFVVEGIIGQPGQVDWYSFAAKKADLFEATVFARRLRSKLDPVLASICGKETKNDDIANYQVDSRLTVKMGDERCLLSVADSRGEGGADFAYRLVVEKPRAHGVLTTEPIEKQTLIPRFKAGQQMAVPRGGRCLLLLRKLELGEELPPFRAEVSGLPTGVQPEIGATLPGQTYHPIVLSSTDDAPLDATFATPRGIPAKGGPPIEFQQDLGLINGHPAQSHWHTPTFEQVAVATVERLPFSVTMSVADKVPQGGKGRLLVKVQRDAGWSQPVMLMFPCQPPGSDVNMIEVPPEKSEVEVSFDVTASLPVGRWPLVAVATDTDLAHLRNDKWPYYDQNEGGTQGLNWTCTPITYLEILPPAAAASK
ncbi:MAG: hypothetical protein ABIP20_00050 [Chthoniobacteraceae bacterium]